MSTKYQRWTFDPKEINHYINQQTDHGQWSSLSRIHFLAKLTYLEWGLFKLIGFLSPGQCTHPSAAVNRGCQVLILVLFYGKLTSLASLEAMTRYHKDSRLETFRRVGHGSLNSRFKVGLPPNAKYLPQCPVAQGQSYSLAQTWALLSLFSCPVLLPSSLETMSKLWHSHRKH